MAVCNTDVLSMPQIFYQNSLNCKELRFAFFSDVSFFHIAENCAAGSTAAEEGPGCVLCAADTHKAHPGRQHCVDCPALTTTLGATGAEHKDECLGKGCSVSYIGGLSEGNGVVKMNLKHILALSGSV